jgi:hypothetical protein
VFLISHPSGSGFLGVNGQCGVPFPVHPAIDSSIQASHPGTITPFRFLLNALIIHVTSRHRPREFSSFCQGFSLQKPVHSCFARCAAQPKFGRS